MTQNIIKMMSKLPKLSISLRIVLQSIHKTFISNNFEVKLSPLPESLVLTETFIPETCGLVFPGAQFTRALSIMTVVPGSHFGDVEMNMVL